MFAGLDRKGGWTDFLLLLVFVAGSTYLTLLVDRANFVGLITAFAALFFAYFILLRRLNRFGVKQLFILAVMLRIIPFFGDAQLSDDYHRFLWDGQLIHHGENPYLHLPEDLKEDALAGRFGLSKTHYEALNSKSYYTVYPPVKQFCFWLAASMGGEDPIAGRLVLRSLLLLGELLLMALLLLLLRGLSWPPERFAWYALNPLVLVEVVGNFHFEGMVVSFLALAAFCLLKAHKLVKPQGQRTYALLGGLAFGLAVSVKLTPLMLLPLIAASLPWKRIFLPFAVGIALAFLGSFAPFLSDAEALIAHFQDSLGLYFRSFEFNASLYYLARNAGMQVLGYNPIAVVGPTLSLLSFFGILGLAIHARWRGVSHVRLFARYALYTYALYLFLATTVHPWYLVTLVALAVFAQRWSALLWSFLVLFSYSHYQGGGFEENYFLIAVEYLLLAAAIYLDFRSKDPESRQPSKVLTV